MATNTSPRRELALWMAWAYNSLPVPLSEASSTAASVAAAFWARAFTAWTFSSTATMESKV